MTDWWSQPQLQPLDTASISTFYYEAEQNAYAALHLLCDMGVLQSPETQNILRITCQS